MISPESTKKREQNVNSISRFDMEQEIRRNNNDEIGSFCASISNNYTFTRILLIQVINGVLYNRI